MPSPFRPPDWVALAQIAIAVLAWEAVKRWRERRKQSWPVVVGRVETTHLLTEMDKYSREIPELCYSYDVNDEHYFGAQEIFEADFDAYPPGSRILVHYKPSDP